MNLVIVGPAFPLRGGIAHHVYQLNKALVDKGHSVHIISYSRLYPAFLFPGKTMLDTSGDPLDAGASPLLDSINPISWIRAFKTIKDLNPALIVFEWWTPFLAPAIGTLVRLLGRRGFKCIVECHNILPHERTLLDLSMVEYGICAASAFIAFSKKNLDYLVELFPQKMSFYTALPAPFSHTSTAARAGTTILFFGIIRPYKGLDVLLHALQIALRSVDCRLIIAGEFYESADRYIKLINQFGLAAHVEINDRYIPNEEIPRLLDRADVLALPYRDATQSGVLRMALSSGLPVIASEVGAFAQEVKPGINGLLVKPDDPDSLAGALIRYFKEGLGPRLAGNLKATHSGKDASELAGIIESLAGQPLFQVHARG